MPKTITSLPNLNTNKALHPYRNPHPQAAIVITWNLNSSVQINCSNDSTNRLLCKTTTNNSETHSFAKSYKTWSSWRRTLYYAFCDLTKISHKRRCIQRYTENEQFTSDFSSSTLMNSRKCFTNRYTWQITFEMNSFQEKIVQLFTWFDTNATKIQIDANLYHKPTDYKKVLLNYFREPKKPVYKWLPTHNYATNEWFQRLKRSATYHSWRKEFTKRYQYVIMLQMNDLN